MCNSDELVRSAQTSWTPSFGAVAGWFSAGVYWEVTTTNPVVAVNDCTGWTTNTSTIWGATWYANPSEPTDESCNGSYPGLCCD